MRRGVLLAGVILAVTALAPPASASAAESEVTFTNGGVTLHGTVVAPPGGTKLPGLVMVHGSGAHSRDDYRDQAEAFARQGIATLIYDKRTDGYSQFNGVWFGAVKRKRSFIIGSIGNGRRADQ